MFKTVKILVVLICFSIFSGCNEQTDKVTTNAEMGSNIANKSEQKIPFDLSAQKKAFALTDFSVLDISESEYDKTPVLAISLSVPVDATTNFNQHIQVNDHEGQLIPGKWILNASQTRLFFKHIKPQYNYQIRVDKELLSINGQHLPKNYDEKIITKHLEKSVRFLNRGNVLPSKITTGLAVESVNVKEVDIDFHRVENSNIARVLSQQLRGYSIYEREIPEYAELVYSARYVLDFTQNKRVTTNLPIHQVSELKKAGFYIAVLKPAGSYPYSHQVTSFYLTDLALHVRSFDKKNYIQTMNLTSGQVVDNVTINVISQKGEALAKGTTNAQGSFETSRWDDDAVIIAKKSDDFAVLSLASPALDLSEQLTHTRHQLSHELFLYGPRDLYRPGEFVEINGLLRGVDGESVASVPLQVTLIRPDSRVAKEFTWHPKQEGFYQQKFKLSKSEPTGNWNYQVKHPAGHTIEYVFAVEEFLPEKMKLELTGNLDNPLSGEQNFKISAQGDYLYGAPASGNRVSAKFQVKPQHFPLKGLKDFYFGQAKKQGSNNEILLDDTNLTDSGTTEWLLPQVWKDEVFPSEIVFEATLFESGGRPVTRRLRQLIWPKSHFFGIRKIQQSSYSMPYSDVEFELINATANEELVTLGEFEVSLIKEDSRYYWRAQDRGWDYAQNESDEKVYSRIINTQEKRYFVNLPVEYGTYRIEIKNSQGKLQNSYRFFAGWSWDDENSGGVSGSRPDQVRIQFDKEAYQSGDIAKVKLIAPHLGQALLRVESNQLLWEKQVQVSSLESEVSIPIEQNWVRHDLFFSVLIISESEEIEQQIKFPKRSLGIAPLRLDRSDRELELTINAPELSEPEKEIDIEIQLANRTSQTAFVTLAAVDTGVLSLAGFETPDPATWFYGQRRYSGEIRDTFSKIIENQAGKSAVLKFGGDAELVRGGEQPVTDVQIVSLFSDVVEFDQSGKAKVRLDLPHFNGELRLMALAFSGNRFGHQDKTMKVRSPVVAEISKPRFLALGDKSHFGFDLQNMSGEPQNLLVELVLSKGLKKQSIEFPINLADGEKFTKIFSLFAEKLGEGKIDLKLTNKDKVLVERVWTIGIRPAFPAQFERYRKVLNANQTFDLSPEWSKRYHEELFSTSLEFSSIPPLASQIHLEQLFQYPYGCLEQTTSRAWPLLHADNRSDLNLSEQTQKIIANKNMHITQAIQHISGMQRSDGSFGLWSNQSSENHWLTSYAVEFLFAAKNAGYAVPDSVLSNATKRLTRYVNNVRTIYSERSHYSQSPKHYALAFRAYAAYVLSKNNNVKLSQLRLLNDQMTKDTKSGLPLAHLAAAFENVGDTKTAKILWEKAAAFNDYQNIYTGDYGTPLRDITWIMSLMSESKLSLDYEVLIFKVNDLLKNKMWFSTQERYALYHLSEQLKKIETESFILNYKAKDIKVTSAKSWKATPRHEDFLNKASYQLIDGKKVFVDLQTVGYPKKSPEAVSDGISIKKNYYNLQGKTTKFEKIKSGDYVLIKLDIISEQKMPNALVVDLLPAGVELENPNLEFAYDYTELMVDGYPVYQWLNNTNIKHQEYRDDRYVAALDLYPNQWSTIFYLVRAVTPGVYQVPPTQAEDMYRPELRALTKANSSVEVLQR